MRYLFVTVDGGGNLYPELALAGRQGLPALNAARARISLPPLTTVFEQYRRMDRVLVLTHESFDFAVTAQLLPANVRHVGPQIPLGSGSAPASSEPRRPLVVASLSTTYQAQQDLLRRIIAALGALPVRGLVTTGPAVRLAAGLPGNVQLSAWTPHAQIMPRAALVITHAGMGTVMAAMAHGVPMLCLPMGRDQDGNAARVEHLGLGRVLSGGASAADIAGAVRDALADPALGRNARRHAASLQADIAQDRAVTEMEALTRPLPQPRQHRQGARCRPGPARTGRAVAVVGGAVRGGPELADL